jgi:hypothetical protein
MGDQTSHVSRVLGMSRRDLLRRGAVLGGTLAWITPAIQSLTAPAFANTPSELETTCCACRKRTPTGNLCTEDLTLADCQAFCVREGNVEAFVVGGICNSYGNCTTTSR